MSKVKRYDPTRTGLLYRRFLAEINRRLLWLAIEIRKLLVDDDAFGLEKREKFVVHSPNQFAFTTDSQKLQAFQKWLKDQVDAGILVVSGTGIPGKPWTYEYVEAAYRQGVLRAYIDTNKEALAKSPAWYVGSREQFLRTALMMPTTVDKVRLLYLRTYEQLQGITGVMSQQIGRVMAMGLASGWNPLKIAREMKRTISSMSRVRARMIARTEIVNAHAEGQLDSFVLLGVEKLGILAEWSTAGDELVCPICEDYSVDENGNPKTYTIAEARGLIPKHPNCRCAWIPSSEGINKYR